MEYQVKAKFVNGDGHKWVIEGLPCLVANHLGKNESEPDTLLLVGLHHSCETAEDTIEAIHDCLYDEYQISDHLKNGDSFKINAATVNKHHSWNDALGTIDIPETMFHCYDVHVITHEEYDRLVTE